MKCAVPGCEQNARYERLFCAACANALIPAWAEHPSSVQDLAEKIERGLSSVDANTPPRQQR